MSFYIKTSKKALMAVTGGAISLSGTLFGANPAAAIEFGESYDCNDGSCSLKSLLDGVTEDGNFLNTTDKEDLADEELGAAGNSFTNPGTPVNFNLTFEVADFASENTFGIYKVGNSLDPTDSSNQLQILTGSDDTDDVVTATFQNGNFKANNNTLSNVSEFGYYMTNPNGNTFYTGGFNEDGDRQHTAVFEGNGEEEFTFDGTPLFEDGDYIIAFEDLDEENPNSDDPDYDYNDLVVFANNTESVPEPSMILGVSALAGSLFATRKRKKG